MPTKEAFVFKGQTEAFRQRLILSTLTGIPIVFTGIRSTSDEIGLTDYESCLLQLLEKMTNGSNIEINHTGTVVRYSPGVIIGGTIEHDCPPSRGLGYYLELLCALGPFGKYPLNVTLNGVTNHNLDVSVDLIRTSILPQLLRFGVEELELKILKRGALPLGGGRVQFKCSIVKQLTCCTFTDFGLVKKIRGVSYTTRMSPKVANRVGEAAKAVLTRLLPDIYIYTDIYQGPESGLSPGYALSLVAETNTNAFISAECCYQHRESDDPTPEDLGIRVARQLVQEIKLAAPIDTISIWIHLLFIALGPEDLGKIRIASMSRFTIQWLRDIQKFLGVTFKITQEKTIQLASVGTGYINMNKRST